MADPITGGDDLEDDLDLQADFMAASDAEEDNEGDAIMSNGDEEDLPNPMEGGDAAAFLSDDEEDESEAPVETVGQKRKAKEERPSNAGSSAGPSTPLSDADKKKKRKLKEKERKEKVGQSIESPSRPSSLAR